MGAELGPPLSSGVCVRRALFILFSPPRVFSVFLICILLVSLFI